ncbi:predicted protein, partial [Thalassiosira pseudonana CCMP1335]
ITEEQPWGTSRENPAERGDAANVIRTTKPTSRAQDVPDTQAADDVDDDNQDDVVDDAPDVNEDNDGEEEGSDEPKKRKRKRKRKKASADDTDADGSKDNASVNVDAPKLQSTEHTVFIEGLPFTSSEEALRLPTWQDSGRLRGFGHVVFGSLETRNRALSGDVNGKELGGRYVTVKEANSPKAGTTAGSAIGRKARDQPEGCRTVHVRNLPYDASEEQILESFRVCGKILEGGVRIARNHINGQSKGFGYVEYKNAEGAYAAVQKASKPFGLNVSGRPVFVDYDEGSMKGSFRNKDGKLWSKEHGQQQQSNQGRGGGGGGGRGMAGRGRGMSSGRFGGRGY